MNVARRYPRFRRLLASLAVSQAGDWLYNLALLAFVYERTHSSAWLGRHDRRARPADRRLRPARRRHRRPLRPPPADARLRRRPLRPHARAGAVAAAGLPVVLAPIIAALATAASSAYIPCRGRHHAAPGRRRRPARRQRGALGDPAGLHRRRARASAPLLLLLGPPSLAFAINAAHLRAVRPGRRLDPRPAPIFAPGAEPEARAERPARAARRRPRPARAARGDAPRRRRHRVQRHLRRRDRAPAPAQPRARPRRPRLRLPAGQLRPRRRARRRRRPAALAASERHARRARRRHGRARRVHRAAGRPVRRRRRAGPRPSSRGAGCIVVEVHGRDRPAAHAGPRRLRPRLRLRASRPRSPASSPAR